MNLTVVTVAAAALGSRCLPLWPLIRLHGLAVAEPLQVVVELGGGLVAVVGQLGYGLQADGLQRAGHVGVQHPRRGRVLADVAVGDGHRGRPGERDGADEHLVQARFLSAVFRSGTSCNMIDAGRSPRRDGPV
jgi:hypothetical protein